MNIDYQICACVEAKELKTLLQFLHDNMIDGDNIFVGLDEKTYTKEVLYIVQSFGIEPLFYEFTSFVQQFETMKQKWTNDIIFALSADELPTLKLIKTARYILETEDVDMLAIPRINMFEDLTLDNVSQMYTGNRPQNYLLEEPINELGWHHWPDYQNRIFKNNPNIKWGNGLHSGLVGYKNIKYLPASSEYAITHVKTVKHQERMLKLYDSIH